MGCMRYSIGNSLEVDVYKYRLKLAPPEDTSPISRKHGFASYVVSETVLANKRTVLDTMEEGFVEILYLAVWRRLGILSAGLMEGYHCACAPNVGGVCRIVKPVHLCFFRVKGGD